MTCVIGIQSENGCIIAADSATASEYFSDISQAPKLFNVAHCEDEIIIGGTDSWRMLQLLQFGLVSSNQPIDLGAVSQRAPNLPTWKQARESGCSLEFEYVCRYFIEAARKLMKDGGFATVKDGVDQGGTFIVAFRGEVYLVHRDFQVSQYGSGLYACGSGNDYALGALAAIRSISPRLAPAQMAEMALDAAAQFQPAYVRRPYLIRYQERPVDAYLEEQE